MLGAVYTYYLLLYISSYCTVRLTSAVYLLYTHLRLLTCAAGTHISLYCALVARVPMAHLALLVGFLPLGTVFLDKGRILGKRAPRVSAGGDLVLYTAELRAPFPSFAVFLELASFTLRSPSIMTTVNPVIYSAIRYSRGDWVNHSPWTASSKSPSIFHFNTFSSKYSSPIISCERCFCV